MYLAELHLQNFRSHAQTAFQFGSGVNIIFGENGIGKTNILEAIHYLSLTKSFLTSKEQYVLRHGCPFFELDGQFVQDNERTLSVKFIYMPQEGKRVLVNKVALPTLSEHIGKIPLVIFSPKDQALTQEGPEERRKFMNNILSQVKPTYLKDLMLYQRALTQRNALLMQMKRNRSGIELGATLASWDQRLIQTGSRIIKIRQQFFEAFSDYLQAAYRKIEAVGEEPMIQYQTITPLNSQTSEVQIADSFTEILRRSAKTEREQARTLVGPHRDELVFRLNHFEVRRYASHGQHRTFGMALQLAKYGYLKDHRQEKPILLLDDIFGDLDSRRSKIFLDLLQTPEMGQSILTAAEPQKFLNQINVQNGLHTIQQLG